MTDGAPARPETSEPTKKPAKTDNVPRDDPDEVWAWTWQQIRRGTADRRSPFHAPTLATVDPAGLPTLRTVVLQACDEDNAMLLCHTHCDAGKVAHVRDRPGSSWHIYDRGRKVQVILSGETTVHAKDDLAEERWLAVREFSRMCYRRPLPPGRPRPEDWPVHEGTGREHFCVLRTRVHTVRWLFLHHAGHRGWLFSREEKDQSQAWASVALTT
ncbi:MAG: hypothetical protein AAGK78_07845 [Planctomycetota bacterium]